MKKNIHSKSIFGSITTLILLVVIFSGNVMAQGWSIYDGRLLPNASVPTFITAMSPFMAADNVIIDDPDVLGNKLLRMDVGAGAVGTQFKWRMNFAGFNPPVTFTEITVVMRVKGHTGRTNAFDIDLHYNNFRSRLQLVTATRVLRIRNGTGTDVTLPETFDATTWNTYRVTMTATETRVFVNEDPTPVLTFTPAGPVVHANNHLRFGDGDSGASFGADIDWVIWDITGAYAPGLGSAIPSLVVAPEWNANLSSLSVGGAPLTEFNPDVLAYDVALPIGTTVVPAVTAVAADANALVSIIQASALPGAATVSVPSYDGTMRTYTVNFRFASIDATLSDLLVDGSTIAGFAPDVLFYVMELPAGTTVVPVVTATATDANAVVTVNAATVLPGITTVTITAEDQITDKTYTVEFKLLDPEPHNWSIYDGRLLPNASVPTFITAMSPFMAADNVIIDDPDVLGNKLLRMDVGAGVAGTQFKWRMNFAIFNPPVTFNEITVVMRAKGHTGRDHVLDLDLHYNNLRSRISLATVTRLLRIRNGTGTNDTLPETFDATTWNTYRVTMTATQTNVYVNEDPIPVLTFTPADATSANNHIRFGDGDSGNSFGADIDWVIWDITGAYAPGQGSAIPDTVVTPSWSANLSDLLVDGTTVPGFDPDSLNYDVVLPASTTVVPVVTAAAAAPKALVSITHATALPGTTTVGVPAEDGTMRAYTVNFTVQTGVSITEVPGFRIYPNPAGSYLHVEWANDGSEAIVEILSITGQVVLRSTLDSHGILDIGQLRQGTYILQITAGQNRSTQRFVKQ